MNVFKITTIAFTALLCLSTSCTSTKITSSWQQPNKTITINSLNKVLVVAMFKNKTSCRNAEDQMAAYLKEKGVVAYNYLNENFNKNNVEALRNKIKEDGFDGVITMRLIDVDKEKVFIPSSRNRYPNDFYTFNNYFYRGWNNYYSPGYYNTTKTYVIEVIVFSIKEDNIIWAGLTKTTDPNGIENLTNEVTRLVYNKMKKQRFITE